MNQLFLKTKLTHFDSTANNSIIHDLFINYLNLMIEPVLIQSLTGVLSNTFFKQFVHVRGKNQWRRLNKFIFIINTTE